MSQSASNDALGSLAGNPHGAYIYIISRHVDRMGDAIGSMTPEEFDNSYEWLRALCAWVEEVDKEFKRDLDKVRAKRRMYLAHSMRDLPDGNRSEIIRRAERMERQDTLRALFRALPRKGIWGKEATREDPRAEEFINAVLGGLNVEKALSKVGVPKPKDRAESPEAP